MENETLKLIAGRHVKRAFLPRPVPREIVEAVLSAAAHAPSSRNAQPWRVVSIAGKAREALSKKILQKFDRGIEDEPEFRGSPVPYPEELKRRAQARRRLYFEWMGDNLDDPETVRRHERRNFEFYGAPAVFIFLLPKNAERGNFLDLGFFMQNIMLGFLSFGIDGCPQESLLRYSKTIRDHLSLPEDALIAAAFSCGYADIAAKENGFAAARVPLSEYIQWFE